MSILASSPFNVCKSCYQFRRLDGFAGQSQALLKTHQVGGGVNPGAVARLHEDDFEHGASRAFAVGASHRDHWAGKAQNHPIGHGAHPIQPQINGHRMQALGMCEPVFEGVQVLMLHSGMDCPPAPHWPLDKRI